MSNHLNLAAARVLGCQLRAMTAGVIDVSATSGHIVMGQAVTPFTVSGDGATNTLEYVEVCKGSELISSFSALYPESLAKHIVRIVGDHYGTGLWA